MEKKLENMRLSVRKAESVSSFLNRKGEGKITAAMCRDQTPLTIAYRYLGEKADKRKIDSLVAEILREIGLGG